MVTTYLKQSISIKKKDENKFNEFLEVSKEDPTFQVKKQKGTKENPKESYEFVGVSEVFNRFWKFYLKKRKENAKSIKIINTEKD